MQLQTNQLDLDPWNMKSFVFWHIRSFTTFLRLTHTAKCPPEKTPAVSGVITARVRTKTVCSSMEVRVFIGLLQLYFNPRRPSVFQLAGGFADSLYSSAGTVWRGEWNKCLKRECDSWQVDVCVRQAGVEGCGRTAGLQGEPVFKSLWPFAAHSSDLTCVHRGG